jgi:hypothetical protein
MGVKFTADDLRYVEGNYASLSHAEIGAAIGRTEISIRNLCYKRGWVNRDAEWSAKELETLVSWYTRAGGAGRDTLCLDELAKQFGRLKSNVCRKARSLGLTAPDRRVETEKARAAMGARSKKRISEKGHPRGALGLIHSPETRKKLGDKARAAWVHLREMPLLLEARRTKQTKTNLERYGRAGPAKTANSYSRCRRGIREDLGFFVRSRWEANYARYLNWLHARGDIAGWEYEPQTFRFEGVSRGPYTYLPDFKVTEVSGKVVFHEVKGWMDASSRNRLKRFAKFYPDISLIVIDQKAYRQIEGKLWTVIPNWERG